MAFMPPVTGVRTDTVSVPNPQAGPAPKPPEKAPGDGIDVGRQPASDGLAALAGTLTWGGSAAGHAAEDAGRLGATVLEHAPIIAAGAAGALSGLAAGAIPISAGNAGEDALNAAWRHASHAVAHPPESHVSVTPAHTEPRSTVGSITPAKSGVELPNHTGHATGAPQTSPVHISPAHSTSGIGTMTTPINHISAQDQATFKTAEQVQALNPGSVIEKQTWTKRTPEATEAARKSFVAPNGPRSEFMEKLGAQHAGAMRDAGFSETQIGEMLQGKVPADWSVHHKRPLNLGGDNSEENQILIRTVPNHSSLTGLQNTLAAGMNPGDTRDVDFVSFPKGEVVYPAKPITEGDAK